MNAKPQKSFEPTSRTTVKRSATRGIYDRDAIDKILDEALVCHVGFVDEGQPVVIPTIHVRMGDNIYIHGSPASRMIKCLLSDQPACVSVTLVDGLVLARSVFHHSMNYRSVVIFGQAFDVPDIEKKREISHALTDHAVPGRWTEARQPSEKELAATAFVGLPLDECSAKVRTGPPVDDDADYQLDVWAGVIPMSLSAGVPENDDKLGAGIVTPEYVNQYRRV
ncbi:pyridoxamine 5'-phosphate oxidase family protein [bacterium AH-315-J04]|nr:pyridoxamine 5'-phosphate oxidase family protein [bacterium AH-315-J04]